MLIHLLRRSPGLRWGALLCVSASLAGVFTLMHLPAAVLLACMLAGILLSVQELALNVSLRGFGLAQGVLGCLIAHSLQPAMLVRVAADWPVFLGFAVSVIGASAGLGWFMVRRRVFPGTTAVWGLMPGGASAMVLMSASYGADMRLVAVMQYLRVVLVTVLASLVARFWAGPSGPSAGGLAWSAMPAPVDLGLTLLIILGGTSLARRWQIPAGAMLLPMVLATALQGLGGLTIALPQPLLAAAYAVIGWSIGLRFTRPILQHAWRALPAVLAAILAVIGLGVVLAVCLTRVGKLAPLTAYLATSPGGADSVAVIAATSAVDAGFVMTMQVARLLMVIALGPCVSKWASRRAKAPLS